MAEVKDLVAKLATGTETLEGKVETLTAEVETLTSANEKLKAEVTKLKAAANDTGLPAINTAITTNETEEEKIEIEDPEPAGKRSTDTSAAAATGTGLRKLFRGGRRKSKNAATPGAPGDTSDGKDDGSKGPDGKGDGSKALFSLRSPLGGKKKKGKKQGETE